MTGIVEALRAAPTWVWLSVLSGVSFAVCVVAIPLYLARAPTSLLVGGAAAWSELGPRRFALRLAKNAVGALLLVAGLLMLIGPGQGLLTLIVALGLLDVPGKRRLQRKLLFRPGVLRLVNRLRERAGSELIEDHAALSGPGSSGRLEGGGGGGV